MSIFESVSGYIHSEESFSTLDGPGIRYVVFLQGCPLRCAYCHNPDSWKMQQGKLTSAQELFERITACRNFISGVTLSGGEPLLQSKFCLSLCKLCRQHGLHIAIDTSGAVPIEKCRDAIDSCNLVLLDIKELNDEECRKLTGTSNRHTLSLLDYCERTHKAVWIRHVLLPGITLHSEKLQRLRDYLSRFDCVKRIDLLPFHKMGEYKWRELGIEYTLSNTPEPSTDEIEQARKIFSKGS